MNGIFSFQCIENENQYIGASSDARSALNATVNLLNAHKHFNDALQTEWDAFGEKTFEYGVLEEFDSEESSSFSLRDRAQEYLEEWMDVLENVVYLGIIHENTGEQIDGE